ncbi:hypothetical protein YC2023_060161 [Brassica napus]
MCNPQLMCVSPSLANHEYPNTKSIVPNSNLKNSSLILTPCISTSTPSHFPDPEITSPFPTATPKSIVSSTGRLNSSTSCLDIKLQVAPESMRTITSRLPINPFIFMVFLDVIPTIEFNDKTCNSCSGVFCSSDLSSSLTNSSSFSSPSSNSIFLKRWKALHL